MDEQGFEFSLEIMRDVQLIDQSVLFRGSSEVVVHHVVDKDRTKVFDDVDASP